MTETISNTRQDDASGDSTYTYTDSKPLLDDLESDSIQSLKFHLENIGGIEDCEFDLARGVTVLVGENATNRTSTLQGIGAAIGADTGTVRANATKACASVAVCTDNEETKLTREYTISDANTPRTKFSHALSEKGVDALTDFAMLLEENRLRRAVRRGDDLYNVLMSPINTESIQRRIDQLREERSDLKQRIEQIENQRERLPGLKDDKRSLGEKISEVETELESKRTELDSLQDQSTESTESNEITDELQSRRRELERIESSLNQESESIDALEAQLEEIESEQASLTVDSNRLESLQGRISRLEGQKRELDKIISSLSTVAGLNKDAIEADMRFLVPDSETTSALNVSGQTINCWTCGTAVERGTIESRTEEIQELAAEKRGRRDEIKKELSELREQRDTIQEQQQRLETLKSNLETTESEIESRQQRITELREEKAAVNETIEELESELEALDTDNDTVSGNKVALSQGIGELEATLSRLQDDQLQINEQIEDISNKTEQLSELTDRREELAEQARELREVVSNKEDEIVTRFNEHMDELLEQLSFDNLARVWLEKRKGNGSDTEFMLNVTREDDGVYEDQVSNLSESEREVVGLMTAVVGHSVHNVGDVFPLIVLDSLEAIDASRVSRLVKYLEDQTAFLVAALLEEDAAELPPGYTRAAPCSD